MKVFTGLFYAMLVICSCQLLEGRIIINEKSTVIYRKGEIDPGEAKRLGAVLLDYGYFNTLDERTVYLGKNENQYRVTFILNKESFLSDKENLIEGFKVWHQWLQEYAFGYAPTQVILADEHKQHLFKIDSASTTQQQNSRNQYNK